MEWTLVSADQPFLSRSQRQTSGPNEEEEQPTDQDHADRQPHTEQQQHPTPPRTAQRRAAGGE